MKNVVRWVAAPMAVAVAVLGGCSSGPDPEPSPTETGTATVEPTPEPEPTATDDPGPEATPDDDTHIDIVDTPGSLPDFVGALTDSEVTSFERVDGAWVAEGTVTNPTDSTVIYRIYASAMGDGGSTTRGTVQVDVPDVGAGETAGWSATFPLQDEGLTLVLRVERGPAQG